MIDSDILPVLPPHKENFLRDINVEYVAVFMNNVMLVRDRLSHPNYEGRKIRKLNLSYS